MSSFLHKPSASFSLRRLSVLTLYPVFFSIYPLLALLAFNISEVDPVVLWRPLLFLTVGTIVMMILMKFVLRDWHRATLTTVLLLLLFFTYGHAYAYLKTIEVGGLILGRHRQMIPLWFIFAALGVWWAARRLKKPPSLAPTLNFVSIFLLLYPGYQILSYVTREKNTQRLAVAQQAIQNAKLPLGYAPDIYYIILDAYGRADVLQEMFGYDNSLFLSYLESNGFYVADCAQSNYAQTMLSLTSSLNFNYLDQLTDQLTEGSDNRAPLRALGQYNAVRTFLDSQGYNIVSFATNFPVSQWEGADYYFAPPPEGMNDFEIALTQTSMWRVVMDFTEEPPEKRSAQWYRRRTLFALQQLEEEIPSIPSPKFVFAHLVIPHHPFVFDAQGGEVNAYVSEISSVPEFEIYKQGYPDQVTYINSRIEKLVEIILDFSSNPPIIVVQGDHGPAPFDVIERRMKNLNVYYFPDGHEGLYPAITPVNTFRVIFNKYFGQSYPMLEDISYYSAYDIPYNYTVVPNTCK